MNGIFIMWIEIELAWGKVHLKRIDLPKFRNTALKAREALDKLIDLLESYKIPVTWTVLGHLLLDSCSRDSFNGLPHPEMPRPKYSWLEEDWYRYDPCTNVEKDPAWYGKDIVDRIVNYVRNSKLAHDIGCHSFSHQMFGDSGCGEDLARAEVQKCLELMKEKYGIVPKAFAFPRDYVGHVQVLKDFNFIVFRDVPTKLYPCFELERNVSNLTKTYFSLFAQFLSYYFLFSPHVVVPREVLSELWAIPGCLAYSRKSLIPLRLVTAKAIKGIDRAVDEGKVFSMYTHLRNFAEDVDLHSDFEKILSHADSKRSQGLLEVKTPVEMVKELEHNTC